jgi:putative membrane protein
MSTLTVGGAAYWQGERSIVAASPEQDSSTSTKLAVERTRLAHERTLMAWVRTATSLISFGFTVYKFFQYLRESQGAPTTGAIGPREFGGLMIGIGITSLILATIGHRRSMRALRADYGALIPYSLSTVVAGLIGALGVVLLVAVLFRM